MAESTFALEDYSGDAILDGMAPTEVYVPEQWTPEYVVHRLVRALEIVLVTEKYIGPGTFKTAWKEYVLDYSEVPERPARPSAFDVELMEEAISWPALIRGEVLRDAVCLSALGKATGRDPRRIISGRVRKIEPEADRRLKIRRLQERRDAQKEVEDWMAQRYRERKIELDAPVERQRRVALLNQQGEERFQRAHRRINALRRDLSEVMPGKVLSLRAFDGFVKEGYECLTNELIRRGVSVR